MAAPEPGVRDVGRRVLAIALLVAGACGGATAHASKASPSPSGSPSATVTVLPTATPTGPTDLPVTPVGFICRLPVITLTYGPESNTYQGGFINFPSGAYAADANGVINFKSGFFVTQQAPELIGGPDRLTPPFFDAAAGRWVPSSAGETAPDGSTYAYAAGAGGGGSLIHVVDVRHGSEKTYSVSSAIASPVGAQVEDDDGAAVFFAVNVVEGFPRGVWRLDLGTGTMKQLSQVANVMAVHGGYAWAGAVDPHDPTPPQSAGPLRFDSIVQVNLSNGAQTTWFYTPGRSVTLLGLVTNGLPVLNIGDAPDYPAVGGEVRFLDHPSTGAEDSGQLISGNGLSLLQPQGDGDRTWLAGDGGIYLYTQAAGLQRVFAGPGNPKNGGKISPAGACR